MEALHEWKLGDSTLPTPNYVTHLGINRYSTPKLTCDYLVDQRISLARRTAYSLMSIGMHGTNGITPHISFSVFNIYVLPRLLNGFEVLVLKSTHLQKLERYYIDVLKQILS